ncbi:MAG: hypothetical protein ACRDTE_22675 [Pseudonocardiaceae bacterium]
MVGVVASTSRAHSSTSSNDLFASIVTTIAGQVVVVTGFTRADALSAATVVSWALR